MSFMLRDVWHLQFLEEDLQTSPAKLIEMAERGGSCLDLEARQALDHGMRSAGAGYGWS